MTQHEIPKEKVDRFAAGLREAQGLMIARLFTNEERIKIIERHKLSFGIWSASINVGVFKKVADGQYQPLVKVIEPIHAVHVINELKRMAAVSSKNRYQEKKKEAAEITAKIAKEYGAAPKEKPRNEYHIKNTHVKRPRVFSLFWGLVKINF